MTMSANGSSNRRRRKGSTLERRLTLSMGLVILLLLGPAVTIVQFQAAKQLRSSARVRGVSVAHGIAAVVMPALLSYNYVGLQAAARSAAADEGIAYVIIHDKEGLVAGDSHRIDPDARQSADPTSVRAVRSRQTLVQEVKGQGAQGEDMDILDVAVPVYVSGSSEKWGTVRVGVSLEGVRLAVQQITRWLVALGLLGLAFSLLGVRVVSRRITRPLGKLREATTALAQGDLSHRTAIHTADEIEDLAVHFNRMADEIEARQAEARAARADLEALNASLEQEVQARTAAHLRSEGKYRTLVEGSPMGIAILRAGQVVYGNPAYRTMVGDVTRSFFDALDAEDREATLGQLAGWDRAALLGPLEVRLQGASGHMRCVETRWMPIDLDGEPADLCLLSDVSVVRRLQQQVAASDKLRALGELASGVAHDFNNCLAIILGRCQLLARRTQDEGIAKGLAVIEKAAADGGQTVRRIQDFARMRTDAPEGLHDMAEIVNDVVEITRSKWQNEAEGRGAKIAVTTSFLHTARVSGNAAELREALTNLVINAVDAMPRGGTLAFLTCDEAVDGRECVRLDVKDCGTGIPAEARTKIFDPFFSTKGNLGTGLGLSVTYGIVCRHGGTIGVESELGSGTTFSLRLPAAVAGASAAAVEADDVPFIPSTVLVVDDEAEIREVLAEGLTVAGYEVTTAPGGREAIAKLDTDRYDVLMTDLGMPEVTGWDVVAAARERRPDMILGLVTGWGATLDPTRVRESGVVLVIAKPFELNHVVRELRRTVARHRAKAA